MRSKLYFENFLFVVFLFAHTITYAQESETNLSWPIEIESDNGYITTLYQPQLESFVADTLEGRMALTIKPPEGDLIFGAVWFKSRMQTNLENRTVLLREMNIVKTHFPGEIDEEKSKIFTQLLSAEIESWDLAMSLDRILASLDEVDNLKQISDDINNTPPSIYFRTNPAILVIIDGEPIYKKDDESGLEYVVNTPFFIVKDTKTSYYYVNGGKFWYTSKDAKMGWIETNEIPSNIKTFADKNAQEQEIDSVALRITEAPELIIETKSAELILVDGEVDYKPIDKTTLLYVTNSESDIIMDINSQNHYILVAGRWYFSKSLKDGDWKFCEPNKLPQEFSKIPSDSELASVRASIPGTSEAEIALLEQSIPQTATIDRKTASVEVKYDGEPKFEKIEGTEMLYAVNTNMTVLKISNTFYCIDNAVWFESKKASGPWKVSSKRPDQVDEIPPESPVYNVKYTYIYKSTPDVVYVGYLPGYNYSYVYGGVVVYGSGYSYPYWYGHYYYPRPVTYGYGVHYNPYSGWGFSVGISYGWIGWGYHPYSSCYWGPRGYYGGYRHGYYRGAHRGYHRGYNKGYRAGYAAGSRNPRQNVYNNRNTGVRNTANTRNVNSKARPSTRPNNVYTDRKGNVYQRDDKGGYNNKSNRPSNTGQRPSTGQQPNQRPSTGQQPAQRPSTGQKPSQKPSTGQKPTPRPAQPKQQPQNRQQLDRSYQNRSTGTQNYNRSQQQRNNSGGNTRGGGGGGARSGGGRR